MILTREQRQLQAIRELSRIMRATVDLDHLLVLLLRKVTQILDAERATVFLTSQDRRELISSIAEGGTISPIRVPLGEGLAGSVAQSGSTLNITDAYADPRFRRDVDQASGFVTRSVLCMALSDHEGRSLGVIQVLNKRGGAFDLDDEAVLGTVAAYAAISIENSRLFEEQVRAGRLASLGQSLSGVLHDLRTPMTVIAGYAELLAVEESPKERQHQSETILKQIELLEAMTRDVLAFARGESNLLVRKVHLNKFVEEVQQHLETEFEGRALQLRFDVRYSGVAHFDELKVMRAIHNLARNAAQAMAETPNGSLTMIVESDEENLFLRFRDTGPGIPEEVQPRLFQAFATSGKVDGTGLGLAMVKKIIDEHGGKVLWESKVGVGTTFTLVLPLERRALPQPAEV
jgi:signal transduction histidine kinase